MKVIESKSDYWSWRRKSKEILRKRNFPLHKTKDYEQLYKEVMKYYTASYNYTNSLRGTLENLEAEIWLVVSHIRIILDQSIYKQLEFFVHSNFGFFSRSTINGEVAHARQEKAVSIFVYVVIWVVSAFVFIIFRNVTSTMQVGIKTPIYSHIHITRSNTFEG